MTKEEIGNLHFGLFIASIIPLALIYIGYASRFIGLILLAIFVFYSVWLSRRKIAKGTSALNNGPANLNRYISSTFLGAVGVVASTFFVVNSAVIIATGVGMSTIVVGSTIVAFGTSVPVLFVSVSAVRKGHLDLMLGNIVGSCFMHTTFILGIPLIASSLRFDLVTAFSNLVVFSVITSLFLWYFLSSEQVSWREGALLLILYAIFLITSFAGYRP
jgi:cation:H+ antiporter